MKLATLNDDTRDGTLIVVSRDLQHAVIAGQAAPTMQAALENWANVEAHLASLYHQLNSGDAADAFVLTFDQLMAPLPGHGSG